MFTQSRPIVNHSFSVSAESFTPVTDYQDAYDNELNNICISQMRCPNCDSVGTMEKTKRVYSRQVIGSKEDVVCTKKTPTICVTVFKCTCSTCTQPWHAFLPEWLCPFLHYTYRFLFEILRFFYESDENITATAREFSLSRNTIRNIIRVWKDSEIDMNATLQLMDSTLSHNGIKAPFQLQDYFTFSQKFPELPDSLIPLFLQLYLNIANFAFFATRRTYRKCLWIPHKPHILQTAKYRFGVKPPPQTT